MSDEKRPEARLQTAAEPAKAFRLYDELRRSKSVKRALIVAELNGLRYRVIGQMADPKSMAQLCWIAAQALGQIPEDQRNAANGDAVLTDDTPLPEAEPEPPEFRATTPIHSVAAAWAELSQHIFDGDTTATQRNEMRRAFYAGATTLFQTIMAMLDPGTEPTPADLAKMDRLHAELKHFTSELSAGRA